MADHDNGGLWNEPTNPTNNTTPINQTQRDIYNTITGLLREIEPRVRDSTSNISRKHRMWCITSLSHGD